MMKTWRNPHVRRLVMSIMAIAVLELMTGPAGSSEAPTQGFHGSYLEASSFFGLFRDRKSVV
jgi:hypothetical protein